MIVSNDASNRNLNRLDVIPPSGRTDKHFPCEAYVTVQGRMSKAMADQITTVSKQRLMEKLGALSSDDMLDVERVIRVQLGF